MSSVWCFNCRYYGGGDVCHMGRNPEENCGACIGEENEDDIGYECDYDDDDDTLELFDPDNELDELDEYDFDDSDDFDDFETLDDFD